jgi:hypothetical protein
VGAGFATPLPTASIRLDRLLPAGAAPAAGAVAIPAAMEADRMTADRMTADQATVAVPATVAVLVAAVPVAVAVLVAADRAVVRVAAVPGVGAGAAMAWETHSTSYSPPKGSPAEAAGRPRRVFVPWEAPVVAEDAEAAARYTPLTVWVATAAAEAG